MPYNARGQLYVMFKKTFNINNVSLFVQKYIIQHETEVCTP